MTLVLFHEHISVSMQYSKISLEKKNSCFKEIWCNLDFKWIVESYVTL